MKGLLLFCKSGVLFTVYAFLMICPVYGDFWQKTNGPECSPVYLTYAIGNSILFAGGETLLRSKDTGNTWKPCSLLQDFSRNSCFAWSGTGTLYIGTNHGIFTSKDSGMLWKPFSSNFSDTTIWSLLPFGENQLFAGTSMGLFKTTNNGKTWRQCIGNGINNIDIYATASLGPTIYIGCGIGVFYSTDTGTTWKKSIKAPGNATDSYRGITCLLVTGKGRMFCAGGSDAYTSSDSGRSWIPASTGLPGSTIVSFAATPNECIFAATLSNGIYKLNGTGTLWEPFNTGLSYSAIYSLTATGSSDIYTGSRSGLFRSNDSGASWSLIKRGTGASTVTAIEVTKSNHILAGTEQGTVFLSRDSGSRWLQPTMPSVSGEILSFLPVTHSIVLAGTNGAAVLRSVDSGNSWVTANQGMSDTLITGFALAANYVVFAGTGSKGIFISTDSGASWTAGNNGLIQLQVQDIAVNIDGNIFAVTPNHVFRSVDNGKSWTSQLYANDINATFKAVRVNKAGFIYAVTRRFVFYRSTTYGDTWTKNMLSSMWITNTFKIDSLDNLYVGTNGGLLYSRDNGMTWNHENSGMTNERLLSLAIKNKSTLYAGTRDGGVYRGKGFISPIATPVEKNDTRVLLHWRQVRPRSLNFMVSVPKRTNISFVIYTVSGSRTIRLFDRTFPAGFHRYEWNLHNVSNGIYIGVLQTDKGRVHLRIPVYR